MNQVTRHLLPALFGLLLLWPPSAIATGDGIRVAAASDLQYALREVVDLYRQRTGEQIGLSFGSSGNFTRQIRQGAPYDLFFSANETYADMLVDAGLTRGAGKLYAFGHLVLFVPDGSRLAATPAGLGALRTALAAGRLRRLAIANPEHAPYGQAAREALRSAGLWAEVQDVLILGENAAQSMQFTLSGSVDAGIVPHALALAPPVAGRGRFVPVLETLYRPLRQKVVLLRDGHPTARGLYDFIDDPAARTILARYGFVAPGG